MSKKERLRKSVVDQVASGTLSQAEAAVLLGLSTRQMKRRFLLGRDPRAWQ